MIELYGNSIWNNNTPNTDKQVIIADEKELKKIEQSINNAGFNYCAYIRKGNAYIAVNKNDIENIHKLNINIKAVSNSNNKPYKPNKIIGNTPFKNINNKYYQKYSADLAYAVAHRLDELNIPFSGKLYDVYNSVTITIDKAYAEQIQSIAKEITEQKNLIANSNGKITNAIKDAVERLNYSEEQLKSINKAENLLLNRIGDENLLSAFDAMFEGTNKYSTDDIAKLSDEFVKIFENLHGLECVFANRNDFYSLKKEFDKNILIKKYTQDKGFSVAQEKVIKNMIDKNMDSVLDILDFTFSVSEMEDMYLAYQQGDYDRLINIAASVKDTSRIEIEGEIESGTYTPVLPNYDTLDRDLFFNNPDSESVTHIYYNPDANSGGQFVISEINYYEIENALKKFSDKSDDAETFFDYLDSISEQKCIDIGDDLFLETYQKFYSNEHIAEGITDEVKKQLINIAAVNYTVPDKTDYYKSYFEIQSEHPDAIILFRVGDFYEVLGKNAKEVATILNITLMSRKIDGEDTPMIGFPSFNLESNENLLVENGHKTVTVDLEDINSTRQNSINEDIIQELQKLVESHLNNIKKADYEKQTIVINAYAGPGAGKTTSCLEIAEKLKKQGYVTEYVQEYAKELVYDNNFELLDGSMQNQFNILKEQLRRVDRLYGKVDFIVTDAPLLLNLTYIKENSSEYKDSVTELYNEFDNYNYFVERDTSTFETEGRIHNLEQSLQIDNELKDTLAELNLECKTYTHSTIDNIVRDVIEYKNNYSVSAQLKQLNKAQKVAKQNNFPFSDKFSKGAGDDFDTAVYDGSMSADDYEKLHQADIETKADRPTITCDWSESQVFENGKTYSVAEFDTLMKNADNEWIEQRKSEIEKYGNEDAVFEAYRNGEIDDVHLGYAKTKFIINMPNGTQYTERQDIGDGIGGVIDFLKQYPQYSGVVKILEADIKLDKGENEEAADLPITESKENLNKLFASKAAYFPAKTQDENEVTKNTETEQPTLFDFDNDDTLFSDAAHTTVDKGENYVMEDREAVTGAKTKFKNNITAIRILKTLEIENRKATVAEQRQLSLYTGWGGLANAFEPDNDKWKNEYLELKNLLTDDEYTAARSSVLDAFYTDSTIIDSIYKVIQNAGLESGNILEPAMGVGNFFGRLPADLRGKVNLYGVEKDSLSGRIAQKLYPQANITIDGFENTHFNDNSFDVAIGNIPFGDFGVNDKKYNSQNLKIHDYFFLKSLDKVRDGGIIAFVTSKGTLDKKDSSFRRELANRADLVGAIRLPNNAFKSAGTEVTSDIIFLKKRSEPPIAEPTWVSIGQTADGLPVNNYFIRHPEMVLGEIVEGNKMYGRTDDTMCVPFDDGRTLSDLLAIAVNNISFTYTPHKDKLIPLAEKSDEIILPQGIRAESYFKSNNDIYFYGSNNESELITIPCSELLDKKYTAKNINRISKYIQLRDTLRELLDVQQYENNDDKVVQLQKKLNTLYDDYYIRYGLLHNNYNRNILGFDGAYQLVASLEKSYDKSKLIEKSDIFTQRVNVPKTTIEHIDTASEALAISIAEKGIIDFAYMSSLTDIPEENLRINLCANGEIFAVPELSNKDNIVYQTASEYLSGDIYAKLDMAKLSAGDNDIYRANIIALENAMPEPLKAADIDVNIGATWISPKYYEQFMYELFKTPKENRSDYEPKYYWQRNGKKIEVEYSEFSGRWNIKNKSIDKSVTATKTYGAHGYTAYAIFQSVLNLTEPKVYKIKVDEFGRPIFDKNHKPISELDVPATQVVQQKANAIRREFKNWIFKDADRRKDILDTYNRTFNCIKPRQYDGSHLTFPGMNSNIELHEHQKNAIAHAIFGGNTLFAHSVGAGKTFEMIATAMECKRLGLCHKSLFAVPNHLTEQVGDDFLKLYPNANILVATKEDFKAENRKKLMSKIATGNYDAVIIGHTQLKMLPLSPERQQAIYQEQIDNIIKGIAELKAQDGSNFKIKDMERTKKSLEKQLTKLQSAKKDNSIYFEELGIDKLFIDEAHEFKNLFCTTKLQNVSGISSRASQRATELFAKCRYLDEKTCGKGVVFATGTPISNSVTELHTMMRYLNYDFLASHNNMQNFDNWVSTFGVQKKEYELAPAGNKFKERTRIAEYSNLPELMSMFKLIADVRTSDTLNLNVPKCEVHIVDVEPTELQEELVNELSDRADEVNNGSVDPSQDNMLKITGDGRKLGLDPRLIDAEFEDNPGTKLNVCVNNVFDIYEKTTDKKLTQIIFCDLGVPGKGVNVDADSKDEDTKSVTEIDSLEESGKFCVYDDIKDKLIAKGVSSQEIAFIHDAKNEKQKSELFAKVRSGEVRILLGSTGKMGTGTNVQDRIIALHDLDVPWRPSDLEQRRGRMVRQGNINEKVHLYRYVTKGTFDAYSYQLLEKKQKFISQIMTSKAPARKCTDVDQAALSYSEIKALCTGDERIREKLTLENRVKELTAYKSEYDNTRYELEDKVNAYPEQRKNLLCTIGNIQKDIDKLNALPKDDEGSIVYTYNFGDAAYTNSEEDRKSAAKALGAFVALSRQHRNETIKVGDISGYEVEIINKGLIVDDITARLGNGKYKVNFGSLNIHNLSKLENLFTKFNEFLSNAKKELNRIDYDYNSAKEMLTKPFEFEQELTKTTALNIELAQRQNTLTEKECKPRYFSKDSILHKGKSSVISDQNKLEVKRSAPEL